MMVRMAVVDDRVRAAASPWGLSVGEALPGGARSAVFAATHGLGRDLVLRLPARSVGTGDLTQAEAAALRSWAGTGAAVELVAASADALLLTRARPGLQPPWRPEGRLEDTVETAEDEWVAREDAGVEHTQPRGTRPRCARTTTGSRRRPWRRSD